MLGFSDFRPARPNARAFGRQNVHWTFCLVGLTLSPRPNTAIYNALFQRPNELISAVGQLLKLIAIGIAIGVLLLTVRRILSARRQPPDERRSPPAVENMIKCDHCGVFVPRAEAVFE